LLKEHDNFYLQKEEPSRGCLLALKKLILAIDTNITAEWKYGMPFFCYKGKMFCYLWVQKKSGLPYLGIVEGKKIKHPGLINEKRSRMKIMLIDPEKDLPVKTIKNILTQALDLYKTGKIKLPKKN